MTDTVSKVDPRVEAWVPRLGALVGMDRERADLIRGLYELAAWVADHPGLPLPDVEASFSTYRESDWPAKQAVVDRLADALGVHAGFPLGRDHYTARATFGPVEVKATAVTAESMERWRALTSYADSVTPDEDGAAAGDSR